MQPRALTLNLLAQYIGYRDYEAFCEGGDAQSGFVMSISLAASELSIGQRVVLRWPPDRRIVVSYEGDSRFRIVEAANTKLSVGDTFSCNLLLQHEPLMMGNLMHNGRGPVGYVAGARDGIVWSLTDY